MAAESLSDDSAQAARKRRIAARKDGAVVQDNSDEQNKRPRVVADSAAFDAEQSQVDEKPTPHITGIKKQSRYDPGVPMTRDQLKAWRKEARRVRNRESAAASRKKNKERITELEIEVETLQTKYTAALQALLQREEHGQRSMAFVPEVLRQDLMDAALEAGDIDSYVGSASPAGLESKPIPSSDSSPAAAAVSPSLSPALPVSKHEHLFLPPPPPTVSNRSCDSFVVSHRLSHHDTKKHGETSVFNHRLSSSSDRQQQHPTQSEHNLHHQHITPISRPIACV